MDAAINLAATSSAFLSLLGGTFFKLFLSYSMDRLKDWQEYKFELGRMRLQNELENCQAQRHIDILKAQKELGIYAVESEYKFHQLDQDNANFQVAVADVKESTGNKYLDMWNSAIRPALATFCIVVWCVFLYNRNFVLGTWDLELIAATLGLFIGSRITHTGK